MLHSDYTPLLGVNIKEFPRGSTAASAPGEGGTRGSESRLGNITKSTPPPSTPQTDSIPRAMGWFKRQYRYFLHSISAQSLGSRSRVASCQRVPSYGVQMGSSTRGISKNAEGTAHFHGVGSCGSVWSCPVCAHRISEQRRLEVMEAMRAHRSAGGICVMITWTFSHGRHDVLSEMLPKMSKALGRAKSRKGYKSACEAVGYKGQIKALEVTHSDANGWHPHTHEIWFLDRKDITKKEIQELKKKLYSVWSACAEKFGLGKPSLKHGINIQFRDEEGNEAAGAYVSKWGYELTYSQTKQNGNSSKGRSPWAILGDLAESWNLKDNNLWVEYVEAFQGKRQLFWSKGLKALYSIDEMSDEEVSDMEYPEKVCDISAEQWAAIMWLKQRPTVLELAETRTKEEVLDYLDYLVRENKAEYDRVQREKYYSRKKITRDTLLHLKELGLQ